MRKVFTTIIIGAFFLAITIYLVNNVSPWNQDLLFTYLDKFEITRGEEFSRFVEESIKAGIILDFLDFKNIIILSVCGFLAFISLFASVHMFVDKLFYKKFYEEPDHIAALRRGSWVPIVFVILGFLRLVGGLSGLNLIFFLFCLGLIIYIEISFSKNQSVIETKSVNTNSTPRDFK